MLGFSQLPKPIKWQDLLEKGKNGRNASRTGAKIHFSEKNTFGVMGTLRTLNSIYLSVQPYFDYCSLVWGNCSKMRAFLSEL